LLHKIHLLKRGGTLTDRKFGLQIIFMLLGNFPKVATYGEEILSWQMKASTHCPIKEQEATVQDSHGSLLPLNNYL